MSIALLIGTLLPPGRMRCSTNLFRSHMLVLLPRSAGPSNVRARLRVRIGECDSASQLVKSWEVMANGRWEKNVPPVWKTLPARFSSLYRN